MQPASSNSATGVCGATARSRRRSTAPGDGARRIARTATRLAIPFWHHARMSSSRLISELRAGLSQLPPGGLIVGFSGGLDSSVLLHALAALVPARERGLRALHVDHGLHARSAEWSAHCSEFAAQLAVPF